MKFNFVSANENDVLSEIVKEVEYSPNAAILRREMFRVIHQQSLKLDSDHKRLPRKLKKKLYGTIK